MKPMLVALVITLIKKDVFNSNDYSKIATIFSYDVNYLQRLKIDTIKEMLYNKVKQNDHTTLDIHSINKLNENDCLELNKLYNSNFELPSFAALKNTEKSKMILSVLNDDQKQIAYHIFEVLSCSYDINGVLVDPKLLLLDASSGTGKSFLVDCLAICLRNTSTVVIAKNSTLLKSICNVVTHSISAMTTCKFTMLYFDMDFQTAIKVFKDNYLSIDEVAIFINKIIKTHKPWNFNLLIIDEYSMESPLLLLIIIILARIEKVNLLIMGDIKQQNTLTTSRFHKGTNYKLISILGDDIKLCKLSEQMRIKDNRLLQLISGIKTLIDDTVGNVQATYGLKYFIYLNLREKFTTKTNPLIDIYLTDTHKNIKEKVEELVEYAKKNNLKCVIQPFEIKNKVTGKLSPLILPTKDKYLPNIPLVEGCQYVYNKTFVTLKKINSQSLEIVDNKTKEELCISKSIWSISDHACVDDNYKWITKHIPDYETGEYYIIQYPLRFAYFTYYFVQGLTFGDGQKISFDLDTQLANSVYVGFSRIKDSNQITKIHCKDLFSFIYTQYKNDEYFYKVPEILKKEFLNDLQQFYKNKYYKFDDSSIKVKSVPSIVFEKTTNKSFIKTLRFNTLKRKAETSGVSKKIKLEHSELSILLKQYYYDDFKV
ncbi:helicase 2 [Carcinus maenas nudivirus]|uniref:Helicase 2 n=1 Tax=Carcinus maenas nudivirus TaxID=2880837 RepID=A0AAE8Y580_9VIRU|nr:helicase 2 [Carcinus maenas nudivirus]UBZ25660.1 helicase 2 [Carcinus maenas nudivirus]